MNALDLLLHESEIFFKPRFFPRFNDIVTFYFIIILLGCISLHLDDNISYVLELMILSLFLWKIEVDKIWRNA